MPPQLAEHRADPGQGRDRRRVVGRRVALTVAACGTTGKTDSQQAEVSNLEMVVGNSPASNV